MQNRHAFPLSVGSNRDSQGLTKLEWFTGMALVGYLSNSQGDYASRSDETIATLTTQCAKAILIELERIQKIDEGEDFYF